MPRSSRRTRPRTERILCSVFLWHRLQSVSTGSLSSPSMYCASDSFCFIVVIQVQDGDTNVSAMFPFLSKGFGVWVLNGQNDNDRKGKKKRESKKKNQKQKKKKRKTEEELKERKKKNTTEKGKRLMVFSSSYIHTATRNHHPLKSPHASGVSTNPLPQEKLIQVCQVHDKGPLVPNFRGQKPWKKVSTDVKKASHAWMKTNVTRKKMMCSIESAKRKKKGKKKGLCTKFTRDGCCHHRKLRNKGSFSSLTTQRHLKVHTTVGWPCRQEEHSMQKEKETDGGTWRRVRRWQEETRTWVTVG